MPRPKRLLLVGFDGLMPEMLDRFRSDLPNFARLREKGAFTPLLPSPCCDTPTNWTTLVTGAWTGTHGITSFNAHLPGTPIHQRQPTFGAGLVQAEFIWQAAERAGRKAILLNYPMAWPPTLREGITIGGDGLTSPRWTICQHACYHTRETPLASQGTVVELRRAEGWRNLPRSSCPPLECKLSFQETAPFRWTAAGPEKTQAGAEPTHAFVYALVFAEGDGYDRLLIAKTRDAARSEATLAPRQWSGWLYQDFEGGVGGAYRLCLVELSPDAKRLRLFRSLCGATSGSSEPASIAEELRRGPGPYVEGLELAGEAVGSGWLDLDQYTEPIEMNADLLVDQARFLAGKYPWDLLFLQIHSQDGANHNFLARVTPGSPKHNADEADLYWEVFRRSHLAIDHMLGRLLEELVDENTALAAVSDHGAVPTNKHVWLAGPFIRRGLLVYEREKENLYRADWKRTQVWLTNENYIWVNLEGRDPGGVVPPGAYESVRSLVLECLFSLRDPQTGECPVAFAARKEDAASLGQWGERVGDVVYYLKPGYTDFPVARDPLTLDLTGFVDFRDLLAGGGFAPALRHHGIHHSHLPDAALGPASNRGILLLSGPGVAEDAALSRANSVDVTPTLARLLDLPMPKQAEGRVLDRFLQ
jgi:predicted AlkP superfamily phosphohydrolase/phosphomutase